MSFSKESISPSTPKLTGVFEEKVLSAFEDPELSELLINGMGGVQRVYQSCGRKVFEARAFFESREAFRSCFQDLARSQNKRLDPLEPAAGGDWFDPLRQVHLRWHCVLPPIAPEGPLATIRRHLFNALELEAFHLSQGVIGQLEEWLRERRPLLIAGPTYTGKSSFLYALLKRYAAQERVLVLEQVPELPLSQHPLWTRLLSRGPNFEGLGAFSLKRAFEESLRLSPERIVVGELRGPEIEAFVGALASGHESLLATIHAGSLAELALRLKTLSEAIYSPALAQDLVRLCRAVVLRSKPHPQILEMGALS